jgi:hypothetical protein
MAGPIGRTVRIVVGLALIAWGWSLNSTVGWIVAAIGLLATASGALNFCALAPLFGAPLMGRDLKD